ncbi:MAG TPA: hypothetical protein VMB66_08870 [Candidatus Acidoferrales bacterium]|nr:hypothetical protein [Candidatus Acidoferrales bacterium]
MDRSWQVDSGRLLCHWSDMGQRIAYTPLWMKEASNVPSGYLPPVPDFASHSPFGGAFWFEPITTRPASE